MHGAIALSVLPLVYALFVAYSVGRTIAAVRRLPSAQPSLERWPRLSIIVPACNEEATIEAALRSKLAARYPDLELVVVDDRSTDETGAIADRIAREDPRVRIVHVTELPAGWLGKLHALERGAAAASGELLLFSDADVEFSPDLLRGAVGTLEREKLDFLTLVPHFTSRSLFLDVSLTTFLRILVTVGRIWKMRDPASPIAVGAGVFNLVRRATLERSPGFSWLRMEAGDDVAFGQMLKRSGARCDVYNGADDVRLAFYPSVAGMVRGFEKNAYAAAGYRPGLAALTQAASLYFELWPILAPAFLTGAALAMTLCTLGLLVAMQVAIAAWASRPIVSALIPGVGPILLWYTTARAVVLAHRRKGIVWRGTFYSLAELRSGVRLERI